MSAPAVEFQIHDLDAVLDTMRTLTPKLQRKGLRTAVRRGAMVVRAAARANARKIDDPETPSKIWKNIALQYARRESRRQKGVVYRVGVRGGARAKGKKARKDPQATYHWRFIELGTSRIEARPFMLPALKNNIPRATNAVVKSLSIEIGKLAEQGRSRARGRGPG